MAQRARLLGEGIVNAVPGQIKALRKLRPERSQYIVVAQSGLHIPKRSRGCRSPFQLQRSVDRDEGSQQQVGSVDRDHATDVGGSSCQTLPYSHELDPIPIVDAELSRAVFAGHLAYLGRDTDASEGSDDQFTHVPESRVNGRPRIGFGDGKGEGNGVLREYGGATSRQPFHGCETCSVRRGDSGSILRGNRVTSAERDFSSRHIETNG